MDTLSGLFASLDMRTLALAAAVLYLALTVVMVYTYRFFKTYPGFGHFTLGQVCWAAGVCTTFFRFLGGNLSLAMGNLLLLAHALFWYYGIASYGKINHIKQRNRLNMALFLPTYCLLLYYTYIDFDTCLRVIIFSAFSALFYIRIALEPFCLKGWKTYPMQSVFSGALLLMSLGYLLRVALTVGQADCVLGGADALTKTMMALSMFVIPLVAYTQLSMTSSRVEAELGDAQEELRQQAETDALTGLPNRRHFLRLAQDAMDRAGRTGGELSLIMLDLDHFKDVNDTHGHLVGDMVLREVGLCMRGALRDPDMIGRLGGEEFGVLLPGTPEAGALRVAHRLRRAVADLTPGGHAVTVSLGVAAGAASLDALLALADECLYAAKKAGRNQVGCRDAQTAQTVLTGEEDAS